MLQVGYAEKFFSGAWFPRPGSFSQSQQAGSMFSAAEEDGGDKRLEGVEMV